MSRNVTTDGILKSEIIYDKKQSVDSILENELNVSFTQFDGFPVKETYGNHIQGQFIDNFEVVIKTIRSIFSIMPSFHNDNMSFGKDDSNNNW